jgi:hypothetical protein
MQNAFKETEIGAIPVEWEVVTVESVGRIVTGTTPSTKQPEYYGGPYMFISPGDMGKAKYVTKAQKYLSDLTFAGNENALDLCLMTSETCHSSSFWSFSWHKTRFGTRTHFC